MKDGEDVDVKRLLGTGDEKAEKEWEEVMQELESTDMLEEGRRKREAKRAAKAELKRARDDETLSGREREGGGGDVAASSTAETAHERRPKFMM